MVLLIVVLENLLFYLQLCIPVLADLDGFPALIEMFRTTLH